MLSRDCLQKQSLSDDTAALSGEVIYRHHFKAGGGGGGEGWGVEILQNLTAQKCTMQYCLGEKEIKQ